MGLQRLADALAQDQVLAGAKEDIAAGVSVRLSVPQSTIPSLIGEHCASVRTKLSFAELAASPGYNPAHRQSLMGSLAVETVEAAAIDLWRRCHPEPAIQAVAGLH